MNGFDFEAIRHNHPLAAIVGESVKLKRSGANKVGCCPFHADKTPSFVVYTDQRYHCFGCGAHGDVIDYVSALKRVTMPEAIAALTGGEAPKLTPADRQRRLDEIAKRDDDEKRRQAKAVREARDRWDWAVPVNGASHPYLARKGIDPYHARIEGDNLLVPLFDAAGEIQSVQMIPPGEGERKLFHGGAPVRGAYCLLGENLDSPIVVVEGYATGATVQKATGWTVAVAYSKAQLGTVARQLHKTNPSRPIVIGADTNGVEQARAAADAVGGKVVVPDMQGAEGTDFNDQAHHYGIDDVRTTFTPAATPDLLPGGSDPFDWEGKRAPHRQFIIDGWIVRGAAGLLSGQEGVGKSLIAQQMATCAALGAPFLGLNIARVNAMYVTCEDPSDELWRRQESINAALGCTMTDLRGRLRLHSLVGEIGNELATFDGQGQLTPTKRYNELVASSLAFGAQLTILDNAAHMFAGNENARHDVAAFLGLIERYSMTINGAAILLAHPNKAYAQGAKQGNEYSGSTGWSAHVRNRLFIDYAPAAEDGAPADPDERVLRKSKANYGKKGEEITFRWHDWAFVSADDVPESKSREIAEAAQAGVENERFLECLDKATEERRTVSVRLAAPNYAPRVFAKMTVAKKMPIASFERAMERLLHLGMIAGEGQVFKRDNRTWALGIVRSDCTKQRTKPAQSDAQSDAQSAQGPRHRSAAHNTPSTTYIGGAPEGASPMYDEEGFFISADYDAADAWRASDAWEPDYD